MPDHAARFDQDATSPGPPPGPGILQGGSGRSALQAAGPDALRHGPMPDTRRISSASAQHSARATQGHVAFGSGRLGVEDAPDLLPDAEDAPARPRLRLARRTPDDTPDDTQRPPLLIDTRDPPREEQPEEPSEDAISRMRAFLPKLRAQAGAIDTRPVQGRVVSATGTIIRATLPDVAIGEMCRLRDTRRGWSMEAEVIGLSGREVLLTPMGGLDGISAETEVIATGQKRQFPVGHRVLGRVIDALGQPIDGRGPLAPGPTAPVLAQPPSAMTRRMIDRPLPIGLRAIDGLLTCGEGQRLGIYGEAGAGKSSLMSAIVKGSDADVAVIALVGERGREVREFVEHNLGPDGLARSVLVVATSDRPAAERVTCAQAATAVAEHFRDQGLRVLLFVDNVTRFARALREIGLAAGEPPTRRGFPPSVFTALPQLMERAGMGARGSITAFYAVLVEDGQGDPIAEETRGILDGHIILSRALAAAGHYPAIDILTSRSRVMNLVADPAHQALATKMRALWARYQEVSFLLQVGEYKPGGDPLADEAIARIEAIRTFLKQGSDERIGFAEMQACMTTLLA
jgi:ATP synthase in type III secretion protein N